MGQVFILERRAGAPWDAVYRPRVAVKIFCTEGRDPELDDAHIRNELNVWIDLDHPAIVPLRKIVRLDLRIGALMPAYAGSLLDRIDRIGPCTSQEAVRIGLQVLSALDYAFNVNAVLHLDVKPANVLLETVSRADVSCRVSDWGIATIQKEMANTLRVPGLTVLEDFTRTFAGFGTLPYMAPERFVRGHRATVQCDIYSVGVLLYEVLSGRRVIPRGFSEHMNYLLSGELRAIILRELGQLSCPRRLTQTIATCVHPNPDNRYRTHSQAADELRSSLPAWQRLTDAFRNNF